MATVRIAIDARPFTGPPNGYTTYLSSVIEALSTADFEITLLTNRPLKSDYPAVSRGQVEVFGATKSWRWEQVSLPKFLRSNHFDIYFAGANRSIPWRRLGSTRRILGLLDAIPYKFPRLYIWRWPFHFLRRELLAQLLAIWRADAIITISESSARDIKALFHRQAQPFLIQQSNQPHDHSRAKVKQFAYVGGVDPRKKVGNLITAFGQFTQDHPDYKLILIGRGYEVFDEMIARLGLEDLVVKAGVTSDDGRQTIISQSMAVVYPSLYEGYGLAIAEAIMADTAVIAGSAGAQREVGGEAALYIDPKDPDEIAKAMEQLLDPAVQRKLSDARVAQRQALASPSLGQAMADYFRSQAKMVNRS